MFVRFTAISDPGPQNTENRVLGCNLGRLGGRIGLRFSFSRYFLPCVLGRGRSYLKTLYYRLQFGPFERSYWVMFHFLTNFVPRVLGCVRLTNPRFCNNMQAIN
ncbi:hypothetical protein KSS87_010912, partial [Heliosperma pusillum]